MARQQMNHGLIQPRRNPVFATTKTVLESLFPSSPEGGGWTFGFCGASGQDPSNPRSVNILRNREDRHNRLPVYPTLSSHTESCTTCVNLIAISRPSRSLYLTGAVGPLCSGREVEVTDVRNPTVRPHDVGSIKFMSLWIWKHAGSQP